MQILIPHKFYEKKQVEEKKLWISTGCVTALFQPPAWQQPSSARGVCRGCEAGAAGVVGLKKGPRCESGGYSLVVLLLTAQLGSPVQGKAVPSSCP